jgi:hypothetical protein
MNKVGLRESGQYETVVKKAIQMIGETQGQIGAEVFV